MAGDCGGDCDDVGGGRGWGLWQTTVDYAHQRVQMTAAAAVVAVVVDSSCPVAPDPHTDRDCDCDCDYYGWTRKVSNAESLYSAATMTTTMTERSQPQPHTWTPRARS